MGTSLRRRTVAHLDKTEQKIVLLCTWGAQCLTSSLSVAGDLAHSATEGRCAAGVLRVQEALLGKTSSSAS